jgi:IS1 family transposase
MNRLSAERRVAILTALVEGNSIRATARMTGTAKGTVLKLLADVGPVCAALHDELANDLNIRRIQADEIWSFCHAKAKNVPINREGHWGYGDVWTWTAICPDSKFMVSWLVGRRDTVSAAFFMDDVAGRVGNRVQLTTDGHSPYLMAVDETFGSEGVDYAMLQKIYGSEKGPNTRYSPPKVIGVRETHVFGAPDPKHVNTSIVERSNLTLRMSCRRFTRLTNAFSKKVENLEHAVALHFFYYNFCRPHASLKGITPAQRLAVADHRWTLDELVGWLEYVERNSN